MPAAGGWVSDAEQRNDGAIDLGVQVPESVPVRAGDTDIGLLRLMTKVATLYHKRGLQQDEIAQRLRISQSRVSRLLTMARSEGIVRTVVVSPSGLHSDLAEELERRYMLSEAHVIDVTESDDYGLAAGLGAALAEVLQTVLPSAKTIGFTSWSRGLRAMTESLEALPRSGASRVVEMLGDVGPPSLQHEAAAATQRLAELTGASPLFLRAPGVVPPSVREVLLSHDPYAREVLEALAEVSLALVGIGTCEITEPLQPGDNFFTQEQLDEAAAAGAVGEINLRFIDAEGKPVPTALDDWVVGITLEQLRSCGRTIAVAGGPRKYAAIRGALLGGWLDALVTDVATAEHLLSTDE